MNESIEEVKYPSTAIFTKSGYLTIQLMDVMDIVDAKKKASRLPWQRKEVEHYIAFASIAICDEAEIEVHKYYTAMVPCIPSETLRVGEDFVFEPVTSNHIVVLTVYYLTLHDTRDPFDDLNQRCLGKAYIPLSRLEENRSVSPSLPSDPLPLTQHPSVPLR